jgi:spermidine synthase
MLTTPEQFDVITSDPIHPWIKGAATLYTVEYFEHVKRRLRPGGVVAQWLPLYENNPAAVKSAMATFFHVFPHGTVWTNARHGALSDLVLVGTVEPKLIDLDAFARTMERPEFAFVRMTLTRATFDPPLRIFATFAGRAAGLDSWLADAELNRDVNLRLQYLAGLTPAGSQVSQIHQDILTRSTPLEESFRGTAERLQALRDAMKQTASDLQLPAADDR